MFTLHIAFVNTAEGVFPTVSVALIMPFGHSYTRFDQLGSSVRTNFFSDQKRGLSWRTRKMKEVTSEAVELKNVDHEELIEMHCCESDPKAKKKIRSEILLRMDRLALIKDVQKCCRKQFIAVVRDWKDRRDKKMKGFTFEKLIWIMKTAPLKYGHQD
jgi:hypothetical protein